VNITVMEASITAGPAISMGDTYPLVWRASNLLAFSLDVAKIPIVVIKNEAATVTPAAFRGERAACQQKVNPCNRTLKHAMKTRQCEHIIHFNMLPLASIPYRIYLYPVAP
jgi:hypothetical protein